MGKRFVTNGLFFIVHCVSGVLPTACHRTVQADDSATNTGPNDQTNADVSRIDAISQQSARRIEPSIPDTVLIDQDGKPRHFYTDLVKGKQVIVNALYTSCPATCPIQAGVFSGVQKRLGDRAGREVQLISITLDPVVDTPQRLKDFAERYKAGPGWVLLTGKKENVAHVLQAMDLYAANPADHTPIAAIGNEPTGIWMKTINLISPVEMMSKLEYVAHLDPSRLGR